MDLSNQFTRRKKSNRHHVSGGAGGWVVPYRITPAIPDDQPPVETGGGMETGVGGGADAGGGAGGGI